MKGLTKPFQQLNKIQLKKSSPLKKKGYKMFIMQYNHGVELTLRHLSICILYRVYMVGILWCRSMMFIYIQANETKGKDKVYYCIPCGL